MHTRIGSDISRRHALLGLGGGLCALGLPGCLFGSSGSRPGSGAADRQAADIAAYEALQAQLDAHRTQALPKSATLAQAVGNRLFYLTFQTFDPALHSLLPATSEQRTYGFAIGSGDRYNYQANGSLVVTAEARGGTAVYSAYRADAEATLVGQLEVPAPADEQRWWAYGVDQAVGGTAVYVVTTGARTTLNRWVPGQATALEPVLVLEDTGAQVGEFWELGVDDRTVLFVESGRLWRLDLVTKRSVWLNRDATEVNGTVTFGRDGVFYTSAAGPHYVAADGTLVDIAARLKAASYRLNETYAAAHHYSQDLTNHGQIAVYVGNHGLFAYDLPGDRVWPILLNPRGDVRVDYRRPTVMDDGTLFVTGLQSTSGAVGAEGPVFTVPAAAWLR